MKLDVFKILKKDKVTDYESGSRLFNIFKAHVQDEPKDMELILDFKNVKVFTQVPFKTLISSMKSRLEGDYRVKLVNQNPLISKSFSNSLK